MEDIELMRIAAFKLRESANRMMTLANAARSAKVRGRLHKVCEQLLQQEKRVFAQQAAGKPG
jgi:hypothetical protein